MYMTYFGMKLNPFKKDIEIDSILYTLKGFLEFINDHIFDCKYENINEMTLNDIRFLNNSDIYGFIF